MKCSSCRIKDELLVEVIALGYVFWLCEDCMETQIPEGVHAFEGER